MDINIRKNKSEEAEEKEENLREEWDMPVSGALGRTDSSDSPNRFAEPAGFAESSGSANQIRQISPETKFQDARPKIREVAIPVTVTKAFIYWRAISRWALILFAGLAPVFFLPFTQFPVAAHKEVLIFTLILLAFFAALGRILVEGKLRYPGHLFAAALLVLVLVWGVSAFFSVNQIGSLIGNWATPDSFFSMLLFAVLALAVATTFNRRDILVSLLVFLSSLTVLGIFELLQMLKIFILPFDFSKNIAFNPVGSVNDLGVLLAFGLIIVSGLASSAGISKLLKRLLILAAGIFLINLIVVDFWAIWVGLALAMVLMISFLSAGLSTSVRRIDSPNRFAEPGEFGESSGSANQEYQGLQLAYFQKAWLPSVVLLISIFLLIFPSPLSKFVQTPVWVSPSYGATLNIAADSLKSGQYFFGSGPNTFGYIFNLYKPAVINQTIFWQTTFISGASAMATWAGTMGILGILSLLFLIFAFVWTGIRSAAVRNSSGGIMNTASQAVFAAVIYLFTLWFVYTVNFTVLAFAFWGMGLFFAASLFFVIEQPGNARNTFKEYRIFTSPPKTFLFSFVIVGLMVGAAAGIYFEANRYIAEVYFTKAIDYSAGNDNAGAISNIYRAINFWQYDERYFQGLSQAIFLELNGLLARKDLPQEDLRTQFQNITANAISAARQAQNLDPKNPANAVLLGSIYENLIPFISDAANFALSSYGAAASLDPENPSHQLALARVAITLKEPDKAASYLEKAVQLKDDYAPARFLLVQVYDSQGKLPEAIKRAEELAMLNNTDIGAMFQLGFLYYKAQRFDDSQKVLERVVELSPNYSNARYFLGLIYDHGSLGATKENFWAAKSKAGGQFEKIAELNPDNAEVKQILANLKAGKPALFGIAPPAPAPQNRGEAPISEGAKAPIKPLKK